MQFLRVTACAGLFAFAPSLALAEKLNVVTSIRPLASLTKMVAGDHANVTILVPQNSSPHTYALKPSNARDLQQADIIFWVDEHLESFLAKPIENIPQGAKIITLAEHKDIHLLDNREIMLETKDDHHEHHEDEHEHHGHDKDAHDSHHDDDKHGEHNDEHDHDAHGHEHHHGAHDLHIWLDPENGKIIGKIIADTLAESDPTNAAYYQDNAQHLSEKLDALIAQNSEKLEPVHHKTFVTFHDAYQYFEKRFDLHNEGVITISPEIKPGAKRLVDLKQRLQSNEISCVFSEPQFDAKLITLAIQGTNVRAAELDPLGANIDDEENLYFDLLNQIGDTIYRCLSGS